MTPLRLFWTLDLLLLRRHPRRPRADAGKGRLVGDRWNNWVFSVRGSAALESEESTRQTEFGVGISADRITPDWKITVGAELDYESEEFDLDEDEPVKVDRRELDVEALVVNGLGEHWSIGVVNPRFGQ